MDRLSQQNDPGYVSFGDQFQPVNHNTASHAWIFMGTIQADPAYPGYVQDRYHNFVTGQQELRNFRKAN